MIEQSTERSRESSIFTAEELRTLATHPGDLAAEAIGTGDLAAGRRLCMDAHDMHRPLLINYALWNLKSLSYVTREYGVETLHDLLPQSIEPWLRPIAETFRNGVTREAVSSLCQIWRLLCVEFGPIIEDDDRIIISLNRCGEFYSLDQDGAPLVGATDLALAALHGQGGADPRIPLFSAAVLHGEALMTGWLGYPPFVADFRDDGSPHRLVIFKDPSNIPLRYFERVGRQRDARLIRGAVDVAGGRLFAANELFEMQRQHMTRAVDALEAGDIAAAIGWCKLSKGEWYPAHHILRDWVTGQLGYIYRRYGVDAVYETVWQGYNLPSMEPMLDAVATQDLRSQVEGLAAGFRQHAMRFRIEEDADKFVFVTEPCGSGGRLIQEGAYAFPKNFPRIRERHRAGFYLENFPIYCVHCPSTNNQVFARGGPHFLMVDGDLMTVPDGNCNFYIFKNPDAVPDRFYRRAGLTRPNCKPCSAAMPATEGRI